MSVVEKACSQNVMTGMIRFYSAIAGCPEAPVLPL